MNSVFFQLVKSSEKWRLAEVRIVIDGRDLIEVVKEHEAPYAEAEGSPSIAGRYSGLSPRDVLPPSRHLFGEAEAMFTHDGKIEVLSCADCGEPGCWPLVCEIVVSAETVTWQHFEQPRRNGELGASVWSYEDFGPFVFDRRHYEETLARLAQSAI